MVVLFSVVEHVLTVNTLGLESGQELQTLSVESVQVDVVDFAFETWVTDGEVNVVDVLAILMLVLLLDQIFLIEFSQGLSEWRENFVEFAHDSDFFAVAFLKLTKTYLF